jgi:hypothetical protein
VTVGDPGNTADTAPSGFGAVATSFQIMKYELPQAAELGEPPRRQQKNATPGGGQPFREQLIGCRKTRHQPHQPPIGSNAYRHGCGSAIGRTIHRPTDSPRRRQ